ncbi:MAG: hypothetical protein KDB22_11575 [Planctomycetales bacterium]|nr:hypothetical protein [Planctomycetales bacterium]
MWQTNVLDSSQMLQGNENRAILDALVHGYRAGQRNMRLDRLSGQDALNYADQLLRVSQVTLKVGQLETSSEFLQACSGVVESIQKSANRKKNVAEWLILLAARDLQHARLLLAGNDPTTALAYVDQVKKRIGSQSPRQLDKTAKLKTLRLTADADQLGAEACYIKYRRGPRMMEAIELCLHEIPIRQYIKDQSDSDLDRIALARALGWLGLSLYKTAYELDDYFALRLKQLGLSIPNNYPDILDLALAELSLLRDRESSAALLAKGEIQNTLGLALSFTDTQRSIAINLDNLKSYQQLSERFPMLVEHQVQVARSYGNLAQSYQRAADKDRYFLSLSQCFENYCRLLDEFGVQRDVIADICIHGVELYYTAKYE